jgi:hypothetical protein
VRPEHSDAVFEPFVNECGELLTSDGEKLRAVIEAASGVSASCHSPAHASPFVNENYVHAFVYEPTRGEQSAHPGSDHYYVAFCFHRLKVLGRQASDHPSLTMRTKRAIVSW